MKNYIQSIMTAALLLVATGTWADNVVVINQLNGTESEIGGTVIVDKTTASGGETVTITVEPATGYYLDPANVTVVKTIEGSKAQTRAPGLSEPLTVTHASGDDVSGEATYTFVMPTDIDGVSYDAEVTVNFSQCISISSAIVTTTETYSYTGEAIVPETIIVNLGSTTLTENTDYTLGFSNNTNHGTATITATGVGKYTGTATGEFTIAPKEVENPTVVLSQTSFDYDGKEHKPTVIVYDGTTVIPASEYEVSYQTKKSSTRGGDDGEIGTSTTDTGTTDTSIAETDTNNTGNTVSPEFKEPGTYSVFITDKKGGNYTIGTTTVDFVIKFNDEYSYPANGDWTYSSEITIVAPSAQKEYDGTPLTKDDETVVQNLPETFSNVFSISVTVSGKQTDVGNSDNKVSIVTIYNLAKEDVTSHFKSIKCVDGCLVVTPAPLTITTSSASKAYDGEPLTNPEAFIKGLAKGETAFVTATGIQTIVGESLNTYSIEWKNAKSSNYNITEDVGCLEVTPAPLTVTTGSASKVYDGEPLTNPEASIRGLVNGERATVIATGSQTNVGEIKNAYSISWTTASSKNYTITEDLGTLIISPKEVKNPTVKLSQTSFEYDGQEHKPWVTVYGDDGTTKVPTSEYEVSYQTKKSSTRGGNDGGTGTSTTETDTNDTGNSETGKSEMGNTPSEFTEPGTYSVVITDKTGGNYIIGTTTVDYVIKAEVRIFLQDVIPITFTYDGEPHRPGLKVGYVEYTEEGCSAKYVMPDTEYIVEFKMSGQKVEECINPGIYTMVVSPNPNGKFSFSTATAEFEILDSNGKTDPEVTAPTPIKGLVYNGENQQLFNPGSSTGGTMKYSLDGTNYATSILQGKDAKDYTVYYKVTGNGTYNDVAAKSFTVTIAKKELKEENFFISNSGGKMSNGTMNPYPAVDSVKVILIEGHQPIKLQKGTDYTFDYFGADNQWIAEDEFYMDKNQNKSINLVVTGKGNYSGEVRRSFTNTLVISSFNELTNTATITGLANSEATTVVIPATVAVNGKIYSVTCISSGVSNIKNLTIDLTNFTRKKLQENPLEIEGGALEGNKVKVLPETLAFFASNPSLKDNVENGQLYADLKADYYLQTFSCGIDITIPIKKEITYVVGKDIVNLGTINDITEYLKFYKCTVKENDGKDEVFVSSIHDQMKERAINKMMGQSFGGGSSATSALLYEANNGVLIACDTTSVINLIDQVNVASIVEQVNLITLATELGYGAYVKYATEDMLKTFVLNNSDLVKKKIKEQFRSTAATLVAQYTKDKPIATGDVKTYGLDNMLVPVTESTHFDATDEAGNTYYILYDGIFHKINDNIKTEVSACKAVLKVPASMAKSRALDITEGDDDTTVISAILAEGDGEARWYNLNGQRIEKPTKKGLYILNGHKVVVK